MNGQGKSDSFVVPGKAPNNAGLRSAAEALEGRGLTKENAAEPNTLRTQSRECAPNGLVRVREAAKRNKGTKFTALMHHVTIDLLRQTYRRMNRSAAAGIDEVMWEQYGEGLEENLTGLHARLHCGAYRAKASRRVYIAKADGRQRPLGIAALEDKIVQGAVAAVLNAIYEEDFLGFSYGFRPGRSQHHALDALATAITTRRVNWVLDADIRSFFDRLDHEWLMKFLEHRIADRRLLRLIRKWLNAGVMESGAWRASEEGVPQGATVSPLLANIFLHYAFDLWVQQWRKRNTAGGIVVVRYADDFIVGFQRSDVAEMFQRELCERLARFSLELHPDKTRLLEFGRFARIRMHERGQSGKPGTFDFLGLTHICGKSRGGNFLLLRHTSRQRLRAKLRSVKDELMRRRHESIPEQGQWLGSVLRGHFAYFAVPTNSVALNAFRTHCVRHWRYALGRRSDRRRLSWERMRRFTQRWLPSAKILHPWPNQRFDARIQGRSPVR